MGQQVEASSGGAAPSGSAGGPGGEAGSSWPGGPIAAASGSASGDGWLVHFGDPVRSGFRLVKGGHLLKTAGIKKKRNKNFTKCSLHITWLLNKKKLRKLPPHEVKSSLQEL